jgi:acetoin utilization protein AcuB
MSKTIPSIRKYMTTTPLTVGAEVTIREASKLMQSKQIRHLPVLEGDKLIGILSERDVALVESLPAVDLKMLTVEDVMTRGPYCTDPEALLSDVTAEMADKKYGAAIIVEHEKVVGIFTMVDACRVLTEIFEGGLVRNLHEKV